MHIHQIKRDFPHGKSREMPEELRALYANLILVDVLVLSSQFSLILTIKTNENENAHGNFYKFLKTSSLSLSFSLSQVSMKMVMMKI
jgi:hypothetical protein